MKKFGKALLGVVGAAAGAFVLTFTVYFFNLDMKLMVLLEPVVKKLQEIPEKDMHL